MLLHTLLFLSQSHEAQTQVPPPNEDDQTPFTGNILLIKYFIHHCQFVQSNDIIYIFSSDCEEGGKGPSVVNAGFLITRYTPLAI